MKNLKSTLIKCALLLCIIIQWSCGQKKDLGGVKKTEKTAITKLTAEEIKEAKVVAIEAFKDAKFGALVQWGLYSIPEGIWKGKKLEEYRRPMLGEWTQYSVQAPRAEWAALANQLDGAEFDAESIVLLVKNAGMKYLVFVAKHHEGFALYDSNYSDFNIVDASPYKKDAFKEMYDACKKHGIKFGIYYSQRIDWADGADGGYDQYNAATGIEPKGFYKTKWGANTWDTSPNTYIEYLENKAYPQVEELMDNYPGIFNIWYDTPDGLLPEQGKKFCDIVNERQPQVMINSRVSKIEGLGDYRVPKDNFVPEKNSSEFKDKPWETVATLNNTWGYKSYDHDWKQPSTVVYYIVDIVSKGGNYLLNIGPKGSGAIPEATTEILLTVGKFLKVNGDAIYGTRPWTIPHEGPTEITLNLGTGGVEKARKKGELKFEFTANDFWFTQKDGKVNAIALVYPTSGKATIKSLANTAGKVASVRLLGSDTKLEFSQSDIALEVILPNEKPNDLGYTLELSFK